MTNQEYKTISEALEDLKDKLINTIDQHTAITLEIIKGQIQDEK